MKKIFTLFACLLTLAISAKAQDAIFADDLDFGTVSIKGQEAIMDSAYVHVTWTGLPDGGYLWAKIVEGEDNFFIQSSMPFYIGYGAKKVYEYDLSIGYYAEVSDNFEGKVRIWGYASNWADEVEKIITVKVNVTRDAIIGTTTTFQKINTTSELKEGDVVVFAMESKACVGGPLYQTYLPAITEDVKVDVEKGTMEVPETAQTFTMSKYNGNWQFTNTDTGDRLLLYVGEKGAFTYGDTDKEHLAGWAIDVTDGEAWVRRPSDDSFPVQFANNDRFKPYASETAGELPNLYKKISDAHIFTSSVTLDGIIDFGTVEKGETKSVTVGYTAEYLTDDIVWTAGGADAPYIIVESTGDRQSGTITLTYNGKLDFEGVLEVELEYLTQDIALDPMEGYFPIDITLIANTVKLTDLSFDAESYNVNLGETLNLAEHLTLTPQDAADKSLLWESSNKAYATVDANGVLTPLISGKVTITVSSVKVPEVKATAEVVINVPAAESIQIQSELTMHIGEKQTLTATVLPSGANQKVLWSIDNTDIATVNKNGQVTAKALGTTVLTATAESNEEISAQCTINVVATSVESIAFAQESLSLTIGSSIQLQPVVSPASAAEENEITYTSDNEQVAVVSSDGIVSGKQEGTAVITATIDGKQAQITVNVVGAQMFAKITSPTELQDKDTIILATRFLDANSELVSVVAGKLEGKQLVSLTENITVTDDAAAGDEAVRLVLATTQGGFTLTPVGSTKALAENSNTFAEANTQNNKVWEFLADENGVYVHNVGNTNAYIKYNPQNGYIRPYKAGFADGKMMYVYVRHFEEKIPTGLEQETNNQNKGQVRKVLQNGQVVIILPDGRRLNVLGITISK